MDSSYDGVVRRGRPVPTPRREYQTWHLHDAGGPVLRPVVRYRGDGELAAWRDGPDLAEALAAAAADGWREFDREPGTAPGEYAVLHLVREVQSRQESAHGHS